MLFSFILLLPSTLDSLTLPSFSWGSFEKLTTVKQKILVRLKLERGLPVCAFLSICLCVHLNVVLFSDWNVRSSVCPEPLRTLKSSELMK